MHFGSSDGFIDRTVNNSGRRRDWVAVHKQQNTFTDRSFVPSLSAADQEADKHLLNELLAWKRNICDQEEELTGYHHNNSRYSSSEDTDEEDSNVEDGIGEVTLIAQHGGGGDRKWEGRSPAHRGLIPLLNSFRLVSASGLLLAEYLALVYSKLFPTPSSSSTIPMPPMGGQIITSVIKSLSGQSGPLLTNNNNTSSGADGCDSIVGGGGDITSLILEQALATSHTSHFDAVSGRERRDHHPGGDTSFVVGIASSYTRRLYLRLLFHFDPTLGNGMQPLPLQEESSVFNTATTSASYARMYHHQLRYFMLTKAQYDAFDTHLAESYCTAAYEAYVVAQGMLSVRNERQNVGLEGSMDNRYRNGGGPPSIPSWLSTPLKSVHSLEEPPHYFDLYAHLRGRLWKDRLKTFWEAKRRRRREEQKGGDSTTGLFSTFGNAGPESESSSSQSDDSDDSMNSADHDKSSDEGNVGWSRIVRRHQHISRIRGRGGGGGGDGVSTSDQYSLLAGQRSSSLEKQLQVSHRADLIGRRKEYVKERFDQFVSNRNANRILRKAPGVLHLNNQRTSNQKMHPREGNPNYDDNDGFEMVGYSQLEQELAAIEAAMGVAEERSSSQQQQMVPDEAVSDLEIDEEEEMQAVVAAHHRLIASQSHSPLLGNRHIPPPSHEDPHTETSSVLIDDGHGVGGLSQDDINHTLSASGTARRVRGISRSSRLLQKDDEDDSEMALSTRLKALEEAYVPPRFRINFPLPKPFTPVFRYLHFGVGATTASFLNSGSYGAPPIAVLRARTLWESKEHSSVAQFRGQGPTTTASTNYQSQLNSSSATPPQKFYGEQMAVALRRIQNKLALLLHTNPADLVFVTNCNMATSIILKSLPWEPAGRVGGTPRRFKDASEAIALLRRHNAHSDATTSEGVTTSASMSSPSNYRHRTTPTGSYVPMTHYSSADDSEIPKASSSADWMLELFDFYTSKDLRQAMIDLWDDDHTYRTDDDLNLLPPKNNTDSPHRDREDCEPPSGDSMLLFSCDYEATFKQAAFVAQERGIQVTILEVEPPVATEVVLELLESFLITECYIPPAVCERAMKGGFMSPAMGALLHRKRLRDDASGHTRNLRRLPKLLNFSHVTSKTGWVFDARAITTLCHAYGLLVSVDGAQAAGAFDVNIPLIGADFYTGTCHKWMFSCPGVAFLSVAPRYQSLVSPLCLQASLPYLHHMACGLGGGREQQGRHTHASSFPSHTSFAMRFALSPSRYDLSTFLSLEQAFEFAEDVCGGWEAVWRRSEKLATNCVDYLCQLWEVRPFGLNIPVERRAAIGTRRATVAQNTPLSLPFQRSWMLSLSERSHNTGGRSQSGGSVVIPVHYPFLSYQHAATSTTQRTSVSTTNTTNTTSSSMPPSRLPLIPLPHSQGCTPADAVKVMGYLLSKSVTAFIVCIERDQAGVMDPSSSRRRRYRRNTRHNTTVAATDESTLHVPLVEAFSDAVPNDDEDADDGSDGFHSLASVHSSDFNRSTSSTMNNNTTNHSRQDEDPFSPGESFLAIRISCSPLVSMEDVVRLGAVVGELRGNYGAVTILKEYLPSSA